MKQNSFTLSNSPVPLRVKDAPPLATTLPVPRNDKTYTPPFVMVMLWVAGVSLFKNKFSLPFSISPLLSTLVAVRFEPLEKVKSPSPSITSLTDTLSIEPLKLVEIICKSSFTLLSPFVTIV